MNSLIKSFFNPLLPILMFAGSSLAHASPPLTEPVDVNVVNTPGVTVQNLPTIEPISVAGTCDISGDDMSISCSMHAFFTVPAGKRLVIEYVSLLAIGSTPQEAIEMSIVSSQALPHRPTFFLIPVGSVGSGNVPRQALNEVVRLYFDAGEVMDFFVLRTPGQSNNISVRAYISGHLVDM